MSSFQSAQKLVLIFIAVCIAQSYFTQAKTIQCINAYDPRYTPGHSVCNDKQNAKWICATSSCGRQGHQWVPMEGCLLGSNPGTSSQQCATYSLSSPKPGIYQCTNSGSKTYRCPYTPSNVPYLTCTDCVPPKVEKLEGGPVSPSAPDQAPLPPQSAGIKTGSRK